MNFRISQLILGQLVLACCLISLASTSAIALDECDCCRPGKYAGAQNTPDSPWTRGRLWLRQTGHFGLFYNCDCEEHKRSSPFICWKRSDSPWTGERLRDSIRCDIKDIKQRIADGSACCNGDRRKRKPCKSAHCKCGR